jgi:phosphoserine phosphatase
MPDYVLVLIAPPSGPPLEPGPLRDIETLLAKSSTPSATWLSPDTCCEIAFQAADEAAARELCQSARDATRRLPLDVALVPAEGRRKKLLVADMESTIIEQECLNELADQVGLRDKVSAITARAMRGELEFEQALRDRVGLLRGLDASILHNVYANVTLMPGAETLVRTMQAHGAKCALVSGGFSFFTERIAAKLKFDRHQSNTLILDGNKLAGTVAQPILGREAKLAALQSLTRELDLHPADTMAVGDGANDLDMLRAAGLGVAFRAKPLVAAKAQVAIVHGDLTALLYLQGYRREDFATG